MIAITGATGTIGSELIRILSERATPDGADVLALTRQPEGRPKVEGVRWVGSDLADPEGLASVLRGVRTLFVLTGNTDRLVSLQKNAIRAAGSAGVERIVKVSALGATDHSRSVIGCWHFNVERGLRDSGLRWAILRPHHFMQNLLDPVVFDRTEGEVRSAAGARRVPFIDTRDIAEVATTLLTSEWDRNEIYTLTGPEALSYEEATEILADTLGRPLRYRAETFDEAWPARTFADFARDHCEVLSLAWDRD